MEINQQQQRERDWRERKRWYKNREYWFRNHMSLYNLPWEMYEMYDYTFKEDSLIIYLKKTFYRFQDQKNQD